jgi:hypothetical protein
LEDGGVTLTCGTVGQGIDEGSWFREGAIGGRTFNT